MPVLQLGVVCRVGRDACIEMQELRSGWTFLKGNLVGSVMVPDLLCVVSGLVMGGCNSEGGSRLFYACACAAM